MSTCVLVYTDYTFHYTLPIRIFSGFCFCFLLESYVFLKCFKNCLLFKVNFSCLFTISDPQQCSVTLNNLDSFYPYHKSVYYIDTFDCSSTVSITLSFSTEKNRSWANLKLLSKMHGYHPKISFYFILFYFIYKA